MIFSREALLSHGLVYWSQSVYQPILLSLIYLSAKVLTKLNKRERPQNLMKFSLGFLAFLGAWTEWTGFITNIFTMLFFWFAYKGVERSDARKIAIFIFSGTVLAGIVIVVHLLLFLPVTDTITALVRRAGSRSVIRSHDSYLEEFMRSYGLFVVVALIMPLVSLWKPWFKLKLDTSHLQYPKEALFLFGLSCFPVIENLILLQHATEFSFDRLKATIPIAIIISLSFASIQPKLIKCAFIGIILLATYLNITKYREEIENSSSEWKLIHESNIDIRNQISRFTDLSTLQISTNGTVRGYLNFIFQRSITGRHDSPLTLSEARSTLFLDTAPTFRDLTAIKSAKVVSSDGSTFEFQSNIYHPSK
jgi:hypothetical protein